MKKMISKLKNAKGFTLVEMIVVMAIIGILVALLAPNVATLIKDAQDTSADAKVKNVMTSLAAYNTKHIKDGYAFSAAAGTGIVAEDLDGVGGTEFVIAIDGSNFNETVQKLWKHDTTPGAANPTMEATEVNFIGSADAYLPKNALSGDERMYLYISASGNVMGVCYADANGLVKAVAGDVGGDLTFPTDTVWGPGLRDTEIDTTGVTFTARTTAGSTS